MADAWFWVIVHAPGGGGFFVPPEVAKVLLALGKGYYL